MEIPSPQSLRDQSEDKGRCIIPMATMLLSINFLAVQNFQLCAKYTSICTCEPFSHNTMQLKFDHIVQKHNLCIIMHY